MAINKVIYGDELLMDITDTTAGANDVVSGKTFYAANGVKTTGTASIPEPATVAPLKDGTAAVGTSAKYAREDHVHPISLLDAYPVGAFYISAVATSPAKLFGGNWERIKGRFILAAAEASDIGKEPDETVCYRTAGATGGSERVTLSANQIPAHTHNARTVSGYFHIRDINGNGDMIGIIGNQNFTSTQVTWSGSHGYPSQTNVNNGHAHKIAFSQSHTHDSVGGGQSHGNMPPYLAAYIWQRIA